MAKDQPSEHTPKRFAIKTAVWPIIISAAALVLSQLPPIASLFKRPRLSAELAPNAQLSHTFGHIQMFPYLEILNSGSAQGVVSYGKLLVENTADTSYRQTMGIQSYTAKDQSGTQFPFIQIPVRDGDKWEYNVNCYTDLTREALASNANIRSLIQTYLATPKPFSVRWGPMQNTTTLPDTVESSIYDSVKNESNRNLATFKPGNYYLLLLLWTDQSSTPAIKKCYSFTILPQEMGLLDRITAGYRKGEGITKPLTAAGIPITFVAIDDPAIVEKILSDVQ
jgi:hypothetical protein